MPLRKSVDGLMFVLDVPLARQAPALAEARGCVRCAPSTSQPRGASLRPRAWRKSRGDDELSGATRESTRTQFQRGQGGTEASSSAQPPQRQHAKRTYLIAVDDSADSEFAVAWAIENLHQPGDEIHLLHCVPYVPSRAIYSTPAGGFVTAPANDESRFFQKAEAMVTTRFRRHFDDASVPFTVDIIREGPRHSDRTVAQRICDAACRLGADAVVMASHRIGKLSEFFLGSVAMSCVHACASPVVVLHPSALPGHPAPPPVAQRQTKGRGRSIVVALDKSDASLEALDWVVASMYRKGDRLHLLHVIPMLPFASAFHTGAEGFVSVAPPALLGGDEELHAVREAVTRRIREKLRDTAIPFDLDVVVEVLPDARASISGAICDVAEDRQAAAVVIAGYGKGPIAEFLLGSVTNYVTHHCTRPTVVFHSAATGQHRH